LAVLGALILANAGLAQAATTKAQVLERLKRGADVLHEIVSATDKTIPEEAITASKCIAVVPSMLREGLIFGTRPAEGVATCRTASGWSAPTFLTLRGGKWGMQFGVQDVDLVLLIMNDKGTQNILTAQFEVGVAAAAAAGPVGRHVTSQRGWTDDTEILAYSRSKGMFAGVSLSGAWITQDRDAVISIYNQQPSATDLLSGEIKATPEGIDFLKAVAEVEQRTKQIL
jgi:lipid-binding SYLF domain-containing protein